MRYSQGYNDWATRAEHNPLPSDRERAALIALKIRDSHSGSRQDSAELVRMEKLSGSEPSSDSADWSMAQRKKPAKTLCPTLIPGRVEIVFASDEFRFTDAFYSEGLTVEHIERAISTYLAGRNDLDYSIHGFEDGGRLTKNTFRTKVKVSDYDPENDSDYNDRSILVVGKISQAISVSRMPN